MPLLLGTLGFLQTTIYLLIVLGIMVLVHEFGHFAVAKLCGVRVAVFSVGMGKRLFGFKRGETDYRVSLLPLGGYVSWVDGSTGVSADLGGEFATHPRWQRILIALAGPFANFVLAIVLLTGVFMFHDEVQQYFHGSAVTDYITHNSPAAAAGMRSGDTIVHFDTVENPTWEQVQIRSLLNLNQRVALSYIDNGKRIDTTLPIAFKGNGDDFDVEDIGLVPQVQTAPIQVLDVRPGMPAQKAGLQPGDQIVSANGIPFHGVPALLAYLQDDGGKPAAFGILRNGHLSTEVIQPQLSDDGLGGKSYQLGFHYVQPPVKVEHQPLPRAIESSLQANWKGSTLIVEVLHRLFTRQVSVRSLSSPIGIGQQIGMAVRMPGWVPIVKLMAIISLNLGIFNLLPMPILDGGMILLLLIESGMRKDLNAEFKERIYQAAFVVLILFATVVIFNDITKLSVFSKLKP